jgi:hypothetical protein
MAGAMAISALAGSRQKLWLEAIEKRVDATAKVLGSMKGIKMTGLTDKLSRILQSMRDEEIKKSEKFRELLILVVGLGMKISPFMILSSDQLPPSLQQCFDLSGRLLRHLLGPRSTEWN